MGNSDTPFEANAGMVNRRLLSTIEILETQLLARVVSESFVGEIAG